METARLIRAPTAVEQAQEAADTIAGFRQSIETAAGNVIELQHSAIQVLLDSAKELKDEVQRLRSEILLKNDECEELRRSSAALELRRAKQDEKPEAQVVLEQECKTGTEFVERDSSPGAREELPRSMSALQQRGVASDVNKKGAARIRGINFKARGKTWSHQRVPPDDVGKEGAVRVRGIYFYGTKWPRWQVKMSDKPIRYKYFPVKAYLNDGRSFDEAKKMALKAANKFRLGQIASQLERAQGKTCLLVYGNTQSIRKRAQGTQEDLSINNSADGNEDVRVDVCRECAEPGLLVLCDGMNGACDYCSCLTCAGLSDIPPGNWFCRDCKRTCTKCLRADSKEH